MNIILSQKVIGREIFETPSLLLAASAPHVGVRVVREDTFLSPIHDESRRSCLNFRAHVLAANFKSLLDTFFIKFTVKIVFK